MQMEIKRKRVRERKETEREGKRDVKRDRDGQKTMVYFNHPSKPPNPPVT